jgi:hypothetical protein
VVVFVDSSLSVVSGRLVGESLSMRSAAVVHGSALSVNGFSFVGSGLSVSGEAGIALCGTTSVKQ